MIKHIFRSTEAPTTSLRSGKTHNYRLRGIPNISCGIPKLINGRERREVGISITPGDFDVTGQDSSTIAPSSTLPFENLRGSDVPDRFQTYLESRTTVLCALAIQSVHHLMVRINLVPWLEHAVACSSKSYRVNDSDGKVTWKLCERVNV
jgi:hypothetical protein